MMGAAPSMDGFSREPLDRALESERVYFELGAEVESLAGAVLAWTPAFSATPAASVVHRVEPDAIIGQAVDWLANAESRLSSHGIKLARIYLHTRHPAMEGTLRDAGYVYREELLFTGNLPDPPSVPSFHPVRTEEDWRRKQAFHEAVPESPDGHPNSAADLVGLEWHKCAHGMDAFTAEIDGQIVGVAGTVWGDEVVRVKNVLIHPNHRRQSVATALLFHIAALGRARGINEQCLVALAGGAGEKLYRSLGMRQVGSCFEWSKRLGE